MIYVQRSYIHIPRKYTPYPNGETKVKVCFHTNKLILLFPFISIHLKSTIYTQPITAHQLSGIVCKSMRCMSAVEGEGEWKD